MVSQTARYTCNSQSEKKKKKHFNSVKADSWWRTDWPALVWCPETATLPSPWLACERVSHFGSTSLNFWTQNQGLKSLSQYRASLDATTFSSIAWTLWSCGQEQRLPRSVCRVQPWNDYNIEASGLCTE